MLCPTLPHPIVLADGSTITLRNPTPSDAEALIEFVRGIDGESDYLNRFPGEFRVTLEEEHTFVQTLLASPCDVMVIADGGGPIVGNGHATGSTLRRFAHHAELAVAVRRSHWGRGLGRRLLTCLIDHCRSRDLRRVWLQVMDHNARAIRLYESLGFEHEGRSRGHVLRADGTYGDLLRMGLPLDAAD